MLASTASRSRDLGALDRIRPLVERDLGGATLERDPSTVAIIGGGPSLAGVNLSPLEGLVHTLAINATATALPWVGAAITHDMNHLVERFHGFPGPVVAGVSPEFLALRPTIPGFDLRRRVITDRLSEVDGVLHSGGHTSAHTALGYAFLLRPKRIVLFGIDLNDFWGPDQYWHTATDPFNRRRYEGLERRAIFEAWERYRARKLQNAPAVFETTVPQLQRLGIEVVNASPESAVDCFPRVTPEEGIAACLEHPAT